MITEGSTWFVISVLMLTFALGAIVMWVVAEVQLRKIRLRLAAAQFQADRADHWRQLSEIEADRVATLKSEVRGLRSKKEAAEAENSRLRRRWDDGVLFAATRTVDRRIMEHHNDPEMALTAVASTLRGLIVDQVTTRVDVTEMVTSDHSTRTFHGTVRAKPFMLPAEESFDKEML